MINKDNKDNTDVKVSTIPKVKHLVAMFDGLIRDEPGQTNVNTEAKPFGKRRLLLTGRNYIGDCYGNTAESGPNKHRTKETSANPAIDGTPIEIKAQGESRPSDSSDKGCDVIDDISITGQEGSRDDICLRRLDSIEMGCDVIEEISISGQGRLYNDQCLKNFEVELGCDIIEECSETVMLPERKISVLHDSDIRSMSPDEIKYQYLQTNQDVIRSEASVIDRMNYADIGKLMENLNMNATSIEEDKQKLKQRLFGGQRIDTYSQKIKDVLNKKVQTYKDLTQNLLELYSGLIATVQNESFKENMSEVTNKRFPHYEDELESIKTMLQNMTEEFEIVVSGETSSGKSTFLNVLLGERILPSHHLHTTASLCRLHNSENKRIECIVKDGIVDRTTLKADSRELRSTLESITRQLLSEDGDDEPLKTIDIYWPISSLHENVVLVDTPGIGERDALTKQVVEYVPKCAGYIFVVDSSHAGGVQDSGIRKLIEGIAVSASKEDHRHNLSKAIFVCNKWDLVPMQDREAVLEDTKRKISKYCGQLKDWQIVQFNADLDLKFLEWKANPTDNFKMLLKSLATLMIRAIKTRLRDKYRWLHKFVKELNGLVTVMIIAAELSKEKVQLEMKTARTYLDIAAKELEKCNALEAMLGEEEKSLLQDLEEYLKSAAVQRKHFDWTSGAPEMSKLREIGPSLIKARIQDAILEWATADTGPLEQASVRITDNCKKLQSQIYSKIGRLNNLELGFSFFKRSGRGGNLSENENDIISSMGITIVLASSPIFMAVARVVHAVGLIPGLNRVVDRFTHGKKKSMKKMSETTVKAIDTLISGNRLQNFITDAFTTHYSKWLTELNQDAAHIISSTRACMIRIEKDLYANINTLHMLKTLQPKLNEYSERLLELDI